MENFMVHYSTESSFGFTFANDLVNEMSEETVMLDLSIAEVVTSLYSMKSMSDYQF
jgi:hypothetical protein